LVAGGGGSGLIAASEGGNALGGAATEDWLDEVTEAPEVDEVPEVDVCGVGASAFWQPASNSISPAEAAIAPKVLVMFTP
jgi:hypothetical protein